MKYNNDSKIRNVQDVREYFHHIVYELHINFHPDSTFTDYIYIGTDKAMFTAAEVQLYDRLMQEAFDVCTKEDADIYEIGLSELRPELVG